MSKKYLHPHTLESLLALPPAEYVTVRDVPLMPKELVAAGAGHAVITNPTSIHPTASTGALCDCLGIVAVNPRTRATAVVHLWGASDRYGEAVGEAVSLVRRRKTDAVDLSFIGACKETYDEGIQKWHKDMESLVDRLNTLENVTVKAFDVGYKPHPMGFAVKWQDEGYKIVRLTDLIFHTDQTEEPSYLGCTEGYSYEGNGGYYLTVEDGNRKDIFRPYDYEREKELWGSNHYGTAEHPFILTWDGRLPKHQAKKITDRIQKNRGGQSLE